MEWVDVRLNLGFFKRGGKIVVFKRWEANKFTYMPNFSTKKVSFYEERHFLDVFDLKSHSVIKKIDF